jgi:hypothetical protein
MLKADTCMIVTRPFTSIPSAAAIFFLLTSYFEAIQSHEGAGILPAGLLRLPLRGDADVASRHAEAAALCATVASPALLNEVCEVLDAAMQRLRELRRVETHASDVGAGTHGHQPRRTFTC